jgi:phosphatidylserine/phosphatidylglycerophosphate/cardiolipin synthase-like enzyme
MAHALIDSIDAEHLDIRRAFRHFDAARAVLDRGRPRRALGHLETGVATALTYALRIESGIEAAARGMEIAEQLGDEALWAGAAEAYGWHKIVGGELGEGFAAQERAFEAADRGRRPFLAFMALNIRGQFTWGLRDPDGAQGHFERQLELSYAGRTRYAQERADGIGRNVDWVHTKFMLVDPLSDDPKVVTGSANFSESSTNQNDENMLVIRGDSRVADIYLGEFVRCFSHHAFREALTFANGPSSFLESDPDAWQRRHVDAGNDHFLRRRYFAQSR